MARVLITGSSDGLGLLAARVLVAQGHAVTLHARSERRAQDARTALPEASGVVVGDLASLGACHDLAEQIAALGRHEAVIHNAGVFRVPGREETADGLARTFAVNVLAPYVLTALVERPDRLVYLTSGMHRSGSPDLGDLQWTARRWDATQAYCDSKLLVLALALAIARRWPGVRSNAVDPGWVPTRMGGAGAPDDLAEGAATQAWLAAGEDAGADVTGQLLFHRRPQDPHPAARSAALQEDLLDRCRALTGLAMP